MYTWRENELTDLASETVGLYFFFTGEINQGSNSQKKQVSHSKPQTSQNFLNTWNPIF